MRDGARTIHGYPGEHGTSGGSEFGKTSSPRKLLGKQPSSRYIQSGLLRGPPRSNKPPAIGWSTPVCRRHLHMRLFGPNGGRPHTWHIILRASVEANSSKNLYGSARSPGRPSKKRQDLEHSACTRGNGSSQRRRSSRVLSQRWTCRR